jgi:hypothetical protein
MRAFEDRRGECDHERSSGVARPNDTGAGTPDDQLMPLYADRSGKRTVPRWAIPAALAGLWTVAVGAASALLSARISARTEREAVNESVNQALEETARMAARTASSSPSEGTGPKRKSKAKKKRPKSKSVRSG